MNFRIPFSQNICKPDSCFYSMSTQHFCHYETTILHISPLASLVTNDLCNSVSLVLSYYALWYCFQVKEKIAASKLHIPAEQPGPSQQKDDSDDDEIEIEEEEEFSKSTSETSVQEPAGSQPLKRRRNTTHEKQSEAVSILKTMSVDTK